MRFSLMQDIAVLHIPRGLYGFEFSIKDTGDCQGVVQVSQVRAGGSAERAGLQRGSQIVAVNGQPLENLTFLQVSNLIRRSSGLSIELSVLTPTLSECGRAAAAAAEKLSAEVQQSEAADELIAPPPPDKPPLLPLVSPVLANDSATFRSPVPPPFPEKNAGSNVVPSGLSSPNCPEDPDNADAEEEEKGDRNHQDCVQPEDAPRVEQVSAELPPSMAKQLQESLDILELHSSTHTSPVKGCESEEQLNGAVDVTYAATGAQTTSASVRHHVSSSRGRNDPRRQALLLNRATVTDEPSPSSTSPPPAAADDAVASSTRTPPPPPPPSVPAAFEDAVVPIRTPPLYADFVDSFNEALSTVAVGGVQLTRKRAYTSGQRSQLMRAGSECAEAHNTSAPAGTSPTRGTSPQPRFLPAYPPRRVTGPPPMEPTPAPNFLPKRSQSAVVPPAAAVEDCRRNASDEPAMTTTTTQQPDPPQPPSSVASAAAAVNDETRAFGDASEVGTDAPDGIHRRHHQGGSSFTTLAAYMEQFAAVDRHKLQLRPRLTARASPPPVSQFLSQRRLSENNQAFVPRPRAQQPSTFTSQHSTSSGPLDGPQAFSNGEYDSELGSSSNTTAGRKGLRSWLKNLKSDDDHVCLLPQAFFSRACLCKIITLDGKPGKSFNWKEYFMCITDEEVRFVRASTAVSQTAGSKLTKAPSRSEGEEYVPNAAAETAGGPDPTALTSEPLLTCCLVLPLVGLFWSRQTQLPSDLPAWKPISSSGAIGGSQPYRLDATTTAATPPCCYLFHHADTGLQLLVIFPDESAATVSLGLCSKYRSGELKENSNPTGGTLSAALRAYSTRGCARTPSPRSGLRSDHSAHKLSHSLSLNSVPSAAATTTPVAASVGAARPAATDLPPPAVAAMLAAVRQEEDERLRTRSPLRRTRKSLPDPAARRKLEGQGQQPPTTGSKRLRDKSRERKHTPDENVGAPPTPATPNDSYGPGTDTSRRRNFTAPILRSIARLISRQSHQSASTAAAGGSGGGDDAAGNNGPAGDSAALRSSEHLAMRIAAVMGEPPDFSSLNERGPVFGAPLESQIQSPDHPGVPLMLDALVQAVQTHGLYHVGLYRAPGRQKEVSRFVCLANLTSFDPDVLLCLEAWKDVRVLSGLVKLFLRRLPTPFFDTASWEPLACLVPEQGVDWTTSAVAFALMSIRVQLEKNLKQIPSTGSSSEATCNWRFQTLDFLVSHLRRVVAYEPANQVNYECISICFGPVLFATSIHMTQMNKILELILRHWPWLVASLDPISRKVTPARHPSLTEVEAYVQECQSSANLELSGGGSFDGDTSRLISPTMAAATDPADPAENVIREMRALFNRAGLLDESILYVDEVADTEAAVDTFFAQSSLPMENEGLVQAVLQALPQTFGPYPPLRTAEDNQTPVGGPQQSAPVVAVLADRNGGGGGDGGGVTPDARPAEKTHF